MKTVPCSARAHQIRLAGAALLFLTALAAASCSDSSTNQDATPDAAVEGDTGTDTRQDTGVDDAQNVGADTEDETARDADSDAQLEADAQADADTEPDAQVDPNADFHTCYPNAFCTPEGEPITMNGLNIRDVDRYAGSTTLEQMQKIKAKGFYLVRLAMYWSRVQPNPGEDGFDSTSLGRVETAVHNAREAGLYVILNPIHGVGKGLDCTGAHVPDWAYIEDDSGNCLGKIGAIQANARDYLQKIATRYADEQSVIAIDLANEITPVIYEDNAALFAMYNTLVNQVRAVDPDKILLIEPAGGDKLYHADELVDGIENKSNIVFSPHFYFAGVHNADGSPVSNCSPTGYRSSGTVCGNFTYENQTGYLYPSVDDLDAHVAAQLEMLADPRLRWPAYIGEYNCAEGLTNSKQWRIDAVQVFKSHNLSRSLWDFYTRGTGDPAGDPPNSNLSATTWGNASGSEPGDWKPWVDDIL